MSGIFTKSAKDFANELQKQVQQDMKDSLYATQQAMNNTAFLARFESFRETIEDRRMAIDLWKDIVIDVAYAFLLIQLLVIIKSTI